jgi:hypothetical protein
MTLVDLADYLLTLDRGVGVVGHTGTVSIDEPRFNEGG